MQLWTFETQYEAREDWHAHSRSFKTERGAEAAAARWVASLSELGTAAVFRVVELVPDGRGGRVSAA